MLLVGFCGCARMPIFRAASAMAISYYHTSGAFPAQATNRVLRNQPVAYRNRLWKNDLSRGTCDRDTGDMRRGRIGARVEARPCVTVEKRPIFARVHEFARADVGRDQYIVSRKPGDGYFAAGLTVVEREKDLQDLLRIDRVVPAVHENPGLGGEMPDQILAPSEYSEHVALELVRLHERARADRIRIYRTEPVREKVAAPENYQRKRRENQLVEAGRGSRCAGLITNRGPSSLERKRQMTREWSANRDH